ncbi:MULTISPECIES: putative bifunctional diguanylate cyclase/phosphodiesterase [Sphingomonas]|uniref:putative bifunctional diguanylate cyclase/phosphodiesterase n=1 Tax=Sphingomonas TaxID=13687 RepID=UPI001F0855BA|nr:MULTISPECIES: EAL domain-containing protein [Sphingomonas]
MLDALPIAAAVISRGTDGMLDLGSFNGKFESAVAQSTVPGFDKVTESCLRDGLLHDHLQGWFNGDKHDELDFRDGWGLETRHYRLRLARLPTPPGSPSRALLSVVDRTTEVRTERSLREEMLRDSLTGLPNRVAFTEMIEAATLDKGDGRGGHAVLVVDLARFSRINESMGSLAGDELLITFARRLISALRAGDRLARTGGNEFGIIVALRRGIADANRAADRILETLSAPFRLSELEIRVECAIGVALFTAGTDTEELFRNAQFACKQAKASGKPEIYEPGEASAARRRFSIETELRRALDRDQLDLAYQPLVDMRTGEVAGFEALARWNHPDRGEISPNEFIPVAEESGLILSLGRWAMHRAAASLAQWDVAAGEKLPVKLGVNLSAIQIARDDVAKVVDDALRSARIGGDRLSLELTESCIVQDPGRATRVFDALKSLDTTLAMDDFGTGYSSLAYLQRLPIDVLKIDRSFVSALMVDPDSVAIVRAVLSLAEALNMKTTAEGIETRELAATLGALGCDLGQGFYYAKPLSEQAALDYWRSRRRKPLSR